MYKAGLKYNQAMLRLADLHVLLSFKLMVGFFRKAS